ncbi:hypothetical protein KFL_000070290 [Klebsormidium nitens]|uniref:Erythromycin esterase n=1 Tax=Klebsormidium nitens TaxID=105231 RepID=A0A1Y1HLM0_KLENI|nr:hypothetical protein KFL_000070290 [Klebsormidium nitens]|eukprot:GAQ78059.1 hypothetical protein KFL_000070290 [Klebsormidium nitens]
MTPQKLPPHHDFWRQRLERGREMGLESELGKKALEAGRSLDIDGVRAHVESLVSCLSEPQRYEELLREIGDAQVVLIGEATHGSREFYEERANISKRLIEEKGFSLVVCEADLVAMARVDRYVRGESLDGSAAAALSGFTHYPRWIWRNKEVEDFVEWARRHNEKVFLQDTRNGCAVSIHGCDLHGLYKSLDVVIQYLKKRDPEAAERAKQRYSGFAQFASDAHEYGFATSGGHGHSCEDDVTLVFAELQDMGRPAAAAAAARDSACGHRCQDDEYFFALQNAVVVKDAEAYYRTIYESYEAAWIIRDRHMFNALVALKEHCEELCGGVCKAVVWAHNCHVSDARATEIAWDWNQINTGQLCKERFGDDAFSIGFSTFGGTLTAAPALGEPGRCVQLRPPAPGTFECTLEQVSPARFLLDSRRAEPHDIVLMKRSIGLVYREDAEGDNYYRAKVFQQYDSMIHIGRTTAVEPLDNESASGEIEEVDETPQTYPFGI